MTERAAEAQKAAPNAEKAETQQAASKMLQCVSHERFEQSSDGKGHTVGPMTDDRVFQNGKVLGERTTEEPSGKVTYSMRINGKDYIDLTNAADPGKDMMFRVGKMLHEVEVKKGSQEYKAVHKVLDKLNKDDAWDKLPVCEIKDDGKPSSVTEPLDLVRSGAIRQTLKNADKATDTDTQDSLIKTAAMEAYTVPLHTGVSRYNRATVLQEVRKDNAISQDVMEKFNEAFEALVANGKRTA